MTRRGQTLFLALGVIWGIPYLLIKVAMSGVTPATLVFARTALGGLLLLPVALARGDLRPVLARWRPALAYTAVEIALPWYLLASAERRLTSSLSALVVATVPIVGALLARTTGARERLGAVRLAGLATGLAGVAVLVGLDVRASERGSIAGLLVVALAYAVGPLIAHRHLGDLPSLGVVAFSLVVSALLYAPLALLQAPHHLPAAKVVLSLAGLGVVCTAGAFLAFFALIAEVGPARATVVAFVNPAFAVLLGVLVLGESFSIAMAVGFVLIIAGSVLSTRTFVASM